MRWEKDVKKPHLLYFLDNFRSFKDFLMFNGDIDMYIHYTITCEVSIQ